MRTTLENQLLEVINDGLAIESDGDVNAPGGAFSLVALVDEDRRSFAARLGSVPGPGTVLTPGLDGAREGMVAWRSSTHDGQRVLPPVSTAVMAGTIVLTADGARHLPPYAQVVTEVLGRRLFGVVEDSDGNMHVQEFDSMAAGRDWFETYRREYAS